AKAGCDKIPRRFSFLCYFVEVKGEQGECFSRIVISNHPGTLEYCGIRYHHDDGDEPGFPIEQPATNQKDHHQATDGGGQVEDAALEHSKAEYFEEPAAGEKVKGRE